ncbi:uncharacterized protein [Mycetomoellerius zeteki]|uniref:uncharacterized protein n=1 Tax=Mycetomoellerius zeteki TaxID=64791 RepID=UPI00084EA7F0|nr:PREDICTED: uncharacterized protein LOC108728093 [Trachymyrmex zeteki]
MNTKDNIKSKLEKGAIIYYVQSYAEQHLCEIVGTINEEQLQNINKCHKHCYKHRCDKDRIIHPDNLRVDLNINMPVDILLKNYTMVNYIKRKIISIDIPNLEETHYISLILGIVIPCYFKANNIILRDLSNLERTEDTVISNVGQTQSIQTGFRLSTVKFHCNYKLTCTFITFSGKIFGTIKGLSIAAKLIIDYDKACTVNLEYVKVKIGQIALQITGLGLFTNLITNQLTHTINTELRNKIEENIRKIFKQQIQNFI